MGRLFSYKESNWFKWCVDENDWFCVMSVSQGFVLVDLNFDNLIYTFSL